MRPHLREAPLSCRSTTERPRRIEAELYSERLQSLHVDRHHMRYKAADVAARSREISQGPGIVNRP